MCGVNMSDSSATLANREGIGKVKHVDMRYLWRQDAVRGRLTDRKERCHMRESRRRDDETGDDKIEGLMGIVSCRF